VHRADPYANRPSPRRRGRYDPLPVRGGPASSLLQPPPEPDPAPLMPRPARITIRETRPAPRRPRTWIGNYRIHPLDVITALLGIAVLLAIVWLR
jgi:hypothetical protein